RRHTRFSRDWSSDVCSSDLEDLQAFLAEFHSVGRWERTLADPSRAVWVAEQMPGAPIGFIAVGPCKLPVENCEPAAGEIHMLYEIGRASSRKNVHDA